MLRTFSLYSISFLAFFTVLFTGQVLAVEVEQAYINVLNDSSYTLKTFDDEGEKMNSVKLTEPQTEFLFHFLSRFNRPAWLGDFLQEENGLEIVYAKNNTVVVNNYNDAENFSMDVIPQHTLFFAGDINSEYDGLEVASCKGNNPARVKIYTYDEDTGTTTKIKSFKPFLEDTETSTYGGCAALSIGDLDADGTNELIIAKRTKPQDKGGAIYVDKFVLFDENGTETGEVPLTSAVHVGTNWLDFALADINGDGYNNEIVYHPLHGNILVLHSDGTELFNIGDLPTKFKYGVGDVDGDEKEEIVTYSGRTGDITIYNENGEIEKTFQLFPNNTVKRKVLLKIVDLTTVFP